MLTKIVKKWIRIELDQMKIPALHSYVQPQFNIKCQGSKPVAYEAKIKRNNASVFLEGLRQSNVS